MRRWIVVAAVVAVLAGGVGAWMWQRGHTGDPAACQQALQDRVDAITSTLTVSSTQRPAACDGLSDAQLADIGRRLASSTPTAPQVNVTLPPCSSGVEPCRPNPLPTP